MTTIHDCVALARAAADRCETVCGLLTCSCASDVRRAADEIERLRAATPRRHITVTIGRHTLLALARGEAVYLNEVDHDGVVTLIHASDYPSALLLMIGEPDVES